MAKDQILCTLSILNLILQTNTINFHRIKLLDLKYQLVKYVERLVLGNRLLSPLDYAYQGKHPPTKLAVMVTASNATLTQYQPQLIDSSATDHVTTSLNNQSFPKPYNGEEHLTVSNDQVSCYPNFCQSLFQTSGLFRPHQFYGEC